jgi:hypothetical protein
MNAYYTKYLIFNKDNKILFKNNNNSCFAEITGNTQLYNDLISSDNHMEIYFPKCEVDISQELIDWYIDNINRLGLHVDLKISDDVLYENIKNEKHNEFYVFTIDFNKYQNKRVVKYTLYFIRYLWEYSNRYYNNLLNSMSLYIILTNKIKKDFENLDFIFCFGLSHLFNSTGHHIYFGRDNIIYKDIDFINFINKLGSKVNNCEIDDLCYFFKTDYTTLISSEYITKLKNDLRDYKIEGTHNKKLILEEKEQPF